MYSPYDPATAIVVIILNISILSPMPAAAELIINSGSIIVRFSAIFDFIISEDATGSEHIIHRLSPSNDKEDDVVDDIETNTAPINGTSCSII